MQRFEYSRDGLNHAKINPPGKTNPYLEGHEEDQLTKHHVRSYNHRKQLQLTLTAETIGSKNSIARKERLLVNN